MEKRFYYKHKIIMRHLKGCQYSVKDFELEYAYEPGSLAPRFSELYAWGLVSIVGSKGKANVYSLTDFGYTYITELYQYGKV